MLKYIPTTMDNWLVCSFSVRIEEESSLLKIKIQYAGIYKHKKNHWRKKEKSFLNKISSEVNYNMVNQVAFWLSSFKHDSLFVLQKKWRSIYTKTKPKYNIVSKFQTWQIRHCSIRLVICVNKMPKSEMG